jgi:hypothetical protein
VVGIARVAEAEHDRDHEDDRERAAVRERCDPIVEPEHS